MFNRITGSKKKILNYSKQTVYYLTGSIMQLIISVFTTPIYAKHLEPLDFTIFGFYRSFDLLIIPLSSFMLTTFYSAMFFKTNKDERKEFHKKTVYLQFINGAIILFICYIFLRIYLNKSNVSLTITPFLELSLLTLLFRNSKTFLLVEQKLNKKAKTFLIINLVYLFFNTGLSLILVVFYDMGVLGRMIGAIVGDFIFFIYIFSFHVKRINFDKTLAIKAIKFSWPLVLAASMQYFLTGIDKLFLERLGNLKEFANYSIAFSFAGYFMVFAKSIGETFEPDIYKNIVLRNIKKVLLLYSIIISVQLIPALIAVSISKYIFSFLTADRYTEAYQYFNILIFSVILVRVYYMISKSSTVMGYPWFTLVNKVIAIPLAYFSYKFLIEKFQFTGAAYAQLFTNLTLILIAITYFAGILKKEKKINYGQ